MAEEKVIGSNEPEPFDSDASADGLPGASEFLLAAVAAGCPMDQIENFLRAGYIAQPWQLEFHAAARECDQPDGPDELGAGGSRGPGKSHMILAQVCLDDCQRVPELKVLYLRRIAKQAIEQFDDLRRRVLRFVRYRWTQKGTVLFPNGSRLTTGHFKDEKDIEVYLGFEYDVIVIEEATTLSATKYQALRDSNRTSKQNFRPRIYNSTNPSGVGHTFYKNRFVEPHRRNQERYTRFFPATMDQNAFIDADYRRKVEGNVGWRLRAYRYGDWDIAVGQYFSTWRYDVHVIAPFTIPKDWPIWCGFDYGFVHPTAVVFLTVDNDGGLYVMAEYGASRLMPPAHSIKMRSAFASISFEGKRNFDELFPIAAGSDVFARKGDTSGKTVAEQYADEEIYLARADIDRVNGWAEVLRRLGDPGMSEGILVPPSIYVFNTCLKLIETIPSLVHDPSDSEDVLKVDVDEDGLGGDDFADALRYGLMAKGVGARPSEAFGGEDAIERYDKFSWGQGAAQEPEPEPSDLRWGRFKAGVTRV